MTPTFLDQLNSERLPPSVERAQRFRRDQAAAPRKAWMTQARPRPVTVFEALCDDLGVSPSALTRAVRIVAFGVVLLGATGVVR